MFDSNLFAVVEAEEAQSIIDNAGMKGIYKDCLNSLTTFHASWMESNPDGKFLVPLTGEGTAFGGKNTDSVYQGLTNALKQDAFKGKWRLIKRVNKDAKGEKILDEKGNNTYTVLIAAL